MAKKKDIYDKLIDVIMGVSNVKDRMRLVYELWDGSAPLFQEVGYHTEIDGCTRTCGCLTQIKSDPSGVVGYQAGNSYDKHDQLTADILKDPRIPKSMVDPECDPNWRRNRGSAWSDDNMRKTLGVFAKWQRKIDVIYGRDPKEDDGFRAQKLKDVLSDFDLTAVEA